MPAPEPSPPVAAPDARRPAGLWVYPGLIVLILAVTGLLIDRNAQSMAKALHEITEPVARDPHAPEAAAMAAVRRFRWTNLGLCGGGLLACLWVAWAFVRRTDQLGTGNSELLGQIAERRKAEQSRSRLFEKLVSAQEEERRNLALELHDEIGGQLSAIKLGLARVETAVPAADRVAARVQDVRELADSVIEQTHRIAWELRPAMLDDLGLQNALLRYIETWAQRTGIVADPVLALDGTRLARHLEIVVFRVVQEALNNVGKHAGAHSVSVIVERRAGGVQIVIEDDGRGFDPTAGNGAGHEHLGLLGMRERVTLAGGTFEIESHPAGGTTVVARLPLGAEASPD